MKKYIAKTGSVLAAFLTALIMVLSLSGCQKATDKMDEVVNSGLSKVEEATKSEYGSAQEIVDVYSAKMEKQAVNSYCLLVSYSARMLETYGVVI